MGLLADFSPLGDFNPADFATQPELGPPYPPAPQTPLQPSLGVFIPGDVVPFSYWDTIISQYANSRIITGLIGNFHDYIDQGANMESLYNNIWNVLTAQGYGLDVWGRIVGIQRVIAIQTFKFFGFEEQTPATVEDFGPGGIGCFYSGVPATSNYALADEAFRALILAKAMSNISSCSVSSINSILRSLFPGRGNCYATDGYDMTMQYKFEFRLSLVEYSIISTSGVLPKPAGVASSIVFPGYI